MKVLNINNFYYNRGGGARYCLLLEKILLEHGHTVIPFSTKNKKNISRDYEKYFVDGYASYNFNKLPFFRKIKAAINGVYSSEAKRSIEKLIIDKKPDIANVHNLFYQISPSILRGLKKFRIPIVYFLNDYKIFCPNAYLYNNKVCRKCLDKNIVTKFINAVSHRCYKNSLLLSSYVAIVNFIHRYLNVFQKCVDLFIVPTDIMKQELVKWGLEERKIRIVPNPFFFDDINPSFSYGDYILFYGSLLRSKGLFTLLKAMKKIPNTKLLIVGQDTSLEEKNVTAYINSNRLNDVELNTKIRWGSGLKKIIDKSMFVVIPSEWPMPMEYTVLEAMAFGKPVIVSDIGGNQTLVKNHWNGLIFKAGDSNDLASKILYLINNKGALKEYGYNGRHLIEKKYNSEVYYSKLIATYKDLLKNYEKNT